jgi:hypothetical protein
MVRAPCPDKSGILLLHKKPERLGGTMFLPATKSTKDTKYWGLGH